ncbi:MAG: Asp-tRNA(Asn)/Glu-tRNA(Gln) amidotransferase subunit GatC [Sulfolobales archaeon]
MDWEKVIKRLSTLALIEIDQTRAESLLRDLERIIEMFNKINELNIPEEVEPLYTTFFSEVNLRDDLESESMGIRELDPAGERLEDRYLKSPRTL